MKRLLDKLATLVRDPRHTATHDELALAAEIIRNALRTNPSLARRVLTDEGILP
jgi:hypothetical protein